MVEGCDLGFFCFAIAAIIIICMFLKLHVPRMPSIMFDTRLIPTTMHVMQERALKGGDSLRITNGLDSENIMLLKNNV